MGFHFSIFFGFIENLILNMDAKWDAYNINKIQKEEQKNKKKSLQ